MTDTAKPNATLTVPALLQKMAALDDSRFKILCDDVAGDEAFDHTPARCERLANVLSLKESEVRRFLIYLSNLYSVVHYPDTPVLDDEQVLFAIATLLDQFEELARNKLSSGLAFRLLPLLRSNKGADWQIKQDLTAQGFLPNAVGFETIVDMRPIFSLSRDKIEKFITVTQLRISTNGDSENEIIMQLDANALAKLKIAIETLERKLRVINTVRDAMTSGEIDTARTEKLL